MSNIFASLDAFRAHCGEPTKPLEDCEICRAIPKSCGRYEKGGDVRQDTIPPQADRLVGFLPEVPQQRGEVKRCPICHRLYFYEYEYEFLVGGSEDTYNYDRLELPELFRHEWVILQRLSLTRVRVQWQDFVACAIVSIDGWHALDDNNQLTRLTEDALRDLVAATPQHGLEDPKRAERFAYIVDLAGVPVTHVYYFSTIKWRKPLTAEEKLEVADLEAACGKVAPPETESLGDRVVVRKWVIAEKRLIRRVTTVFPDGRFTREDAVIGENIPIA